MALFRTPTPPELLYTIPCLSIYTSILTISMPMNRLSRSTSSTLATRTCGVESRHLHDRDTPTEGTPTCDYLYFVRIERNTFSASATSCKEVPLSCYISFSSPYAKVAGRMSTSLHVLNLCDSFLHFTPPPLGVAERSNLMARWNIIHQWEESREGSRGKRVGGRHEGRE